MMMTIERTTNHSQTTNFQQEKEAAAKDIAQGLEELITNLTMLNRNLELVNSLGKDFDQMSHLWSGFRQVFLDEALAQDDEQEIEDIQDVTASEQSP